MYAICDQQSPLSDSADAHWHILQNPAMQPKNLRVKIASAYRLTWAVGVRIHMFAIGIFCMIRIINEKKSSLNKQHRPRSVCPAALYIFHPSSLLDGVFYNIQLFSTRNLSNKTTLLRSATEDKGG